jgi:hypothetical protein
MVLPRTHRTSRRRLAMAMSAKRLSQKHGVRLSCRGRRGAECAPLCGFLVLAAPRLVSGDPFPTPPEPGVLYGPHGQHLHVYPTPNGHVGYDEKGQRFEEFKTPGGGSAWYSDQGKLFGAPPPFPAPVAPPSLLRPGAF